MIHALSTTLAIGGYVVAIVLLVEGFAGGQWPFPGGDVVAFYAPAGDALRAGRPVYSPVWFFYGPPWAVAFGAVSWLGAGAMHAIILALDAVALWTIAGGNLRRLGYVLWFPLIPFEIAAGQFNLIVAAAIVAAQRGTTWPLAAMSMAKVWPAIALRPRDWRRFLIALGAISLVTLPWLPLWPQWVGALIAASAHPLGPVIPVPFIARAVIAAVLVLLQRPWSRALGAAIISPALYWGQLVVLVAPFSLWLARHDAVEERGPGPRPVLSSRS